MRLSLLGLTQSGFFSGIGTDRPADEQMAIRGTPIRTRSIRSSADASVMMVMLNQMLEDQMFPKLKFTTLYYFLQFKNQLNIIQKR